MVTPDLTGLWHDQIDLNDTPYMERWFIQGDPRARNGSVRYHHILTSDPGRDLHDHPWDFTTTILDGTYLETTPTGEHLWRTGDTIHHRAEDLHRLTLTDGPVWTHVTTGPTRRMWGFATHQGWINWRTHAASHPPE